MKKFIAFLLSILIMGLIFSRINFNQFKSHLAQVDPWLFTLAVLFFIPQITLTAYRWTLMIRSQTVMGLGESIKLTLSANALNILLPSRVGDLSKAYFIGKEGRMDLKRGMNVVFFEKYIDLASLGVVILAGVLFSARWDSASLTGLGFAATVIGIFPILYWVDLEKWVSFSFFEKNKIFKKIREFLLDTHHYLKEIRQNPGLLFFIIGLSIFLWFVHILQFYMIFRAFHSQVSLFHVFRLVPLAILVGLIPLTLAGMGTRDSALIFLFKPYESAALVAGVGLFASLRYFVPGFLGLPFLNQYVLKANRPAR